MAFKIKPKDFQKRRAQSQTFKDWKDEDKHFRQSVNPAFGAVTEKDLLYERRKSKGTILDKEYVKCEDTHEVVEVLLGRKTK